MIAFALLTIPLIAGMFWNPDRHPEPFSRPNVYGGPQLTPKKQRAAKRETIENVAQRVARRERADITARLDAENDTGVCPLFGFTVPNSPVGCYGLRESRCISYDAAHSGQYHNCVVYTIAKRETASR